MKTVTPEEQGLIDTVELAVDWNLPVPESKIDRGEFMERKTLERAWLDSYDLTKGTPEEKVAVISTIPSKVLAEETYEAAMDLRDDGINWYGSDFEEELLEVAGKGDSVITNPDVHISVEEYMEIAKTKK